MSSGEDIKKELKNVSTVVKALINSRKPPVFLKDIVGDYIELEGKPLPYRTLGFKTPEELLEATGELKLTRFGNDYSITAGQGSSKSQHIMKLVRSQKRSKSRHIATPKVIRKPINYNKPVSTRPYRRRGGPKNFSNIGDRNNNNSSMISNSNSNNIRKSNMPNSLNTSADADDDGAKEQVKDSSEFRPPLNHQKTQKSYNQSNNSSLSYNQNQFQNQNENLNQHFLTQNQNQNVRKNLNASTNQKQSYNQTFNAQKSQTDGSNQIEKKVAKPSGKTSGTSVLQDRLNVIKADTLDKNKMEENIIVNKKDLEQFKSELEAKKQEIQLEKALMSRGYIVDDSEEARMEYEKQTNLNHLLHFQKSFQQHQTIQHRQKQIHESNLRTQDYNEVKSQVRQHDLQKPKKSIQDRLKVPKYDFEEVVKNKTSEASKAAANDLAKKTKLLNINTKKIESKSKDEAAEIEAEAQAEVEVEVVEEDFNEGPLDNPIYELARLCRILKYDEPEYMMLQNKFMTDLVGTVTVDGKIYSTYPQEYHTEDEAKDAVAQIAIENVNQLIQKKSLPPCSLSVKDFIERLHKELIKHPTGVFAKDIVDWYETTVKEKIHENWWTLVQISTFFKTEEICDNIIVFGTSEKADDPPRSPPAELVYIKPIDLPWHEDYWSVLLTYCESTTEIWARLYGPEYSQKYDGMLEDIDKYMGSDKKAWKRAPVIKVQQVYLVYICESWHRARVESIDKEQKKALCLFIDFGDSEYIDVQNLYVCESRFLELPAQAVSFSLYGLEDFAEHPMARKILEENLSMKSVIARICTKEAEYFHIDPDVGGRIRAVFYDTSTPNIDINYNEELIELFSHGISPPELQTNVINHVEVSHINDRGEVYIRIRNENLKYVEGLLKKIGASKSLEFHKVTVDDFRTSKKFLFCDSSDKNYVKWYRGSLNTNSRIQSNTVFVELFCVDIGKMCSVHINKIYRLESLSVALTTFPPQALKVRLFNILDLKPSMAGRLRCLLPINSEALVKVGKIKTLPLVTFYIRQSNGTLVNINENLSIEQELEGWKDQPSPSSCGYDDDNRSVSSKSDDNSVKSARDIVHGLVVAPSSVELLKKLPKIKQMTELPVYDDVCFQVRVTVVASPWNFSVQPYERYNELKLLMKDLQTYCKNNDVFIPNDMVEIGQAYAAEHSDGYFHRVKVEDIFANNFILISYIDLGNVNTVRSEELKFLPMQFRTLPEMAIQAKLRSIKPTKGAWESEDCLRFRKLTIGRPFIGIITGGPKIQKNGSRLIELDELIDVVNSHDVFIGEILVQENLAQKVEKSFLKSSI